MKIVGHILKIWYLNFEFALNFVVLDFGFLEHDERRFFWQKG